MRVEFFQLEIIDEFHLKGKTCADKIKDLKFYRTAIRIGAYFQGS